MDERWIVFNEQLLLSESQIQLPKSIEMSRTANYAFWTRQYSTREESSKRSRDRTICFSIIFFPLLLRKHYNLTYSWPRNLISLIGFFSMLRSLYRSVLSLLSYLPYSLFFFIIFPLPISTYYSLARMRINFFCHVTFSQDTLSNWLEWPPLFQTNRNAFSSGDKMSIRN